MRDTWLGSGVNSYWQSVAIDCPLCGHGFDEDLLVDDYRIIDAEIRCPKCEDYFDYFEEVR